MHLQGYEPFALDDLLFVENVEEKDIVSNKKDVPRIYWYDEDGKKHMHYVDFFIPSQNRCVEVKSMFTLFADEEVVFKKKAAAEASGLQYDIYVYDGSEQIMVL